jgi:hypothetical protein
MINHSSSASQSKRTYIALSSSITGGVAAAAAATATTVTDAGAVAVATGSGIFVRVRYRYQLAQLSNKRSGIHLALLPNIQNTREFGTLGS